MEDDEMHRIRDLFYAGFYRLCMDVASSTHPSNELSASERESLIARCKFCLNILNPEEANDLRNNPNASLRAVGYYTMHHHARSDTERREALDVLRNCCQTHDSVAKYLTASALAADDNMTEALECVRDGPLEILGLRVQLLVLMNRLDLAKKEFQEMCRINDDAAVTCVVGTLVNMGLGNYQESYLSCGDIQAQCCAGADSECHLSLILQNVKAAANMARREWQEAYEDLTKAHQQNNSDVDTLANLVCCCRNLKKDDECEWYFEQLKTLSPMHKTVIKMEQLQQSFLAKRSEIMAH